MKADEVTPMIAAIQMTSTSNKKSNLEATVELVEYAAQHGATLIALPECCSYIGGGTGATLSDTEGESCPVDTLAAAETLEDGSYACSLCALAKRLGIWLSVGGFPELVNKKGETVNKVYNTHFMISPTGCIVDRYRKIHLFDSPLAGLIESKSTEAGGALVVTDCGFAKVGLTICYDLRFPELYGALCRPGVGLGAEIVLVPSAFTVKTGLAHWMVLLRARAIENQVYVVAAAQVGKHNIKRKSFGGTCIIDPWGV
eukprot:CAMPEP_0119047616 /NCGR_PEP_ID=MMETSP1177-20130426/54184_1 /TAXON_ID=2985 /ORGANISM="Ochromonas sp, Strain CCMP1899" /LENGTH=256 /DNA_ID=CAMNT_0007022423 /DNA_START=379 /DNA_END=1145 /DNA_ORIENTATION=-